MNQMRALLSVILSAVALATTACGAADDASETSPTGSIESGKIIGTNDLVSVLQDGANIPAKYRPLVDAFGKISMGCTATHIGQGLVVTAGHCFNAPSTRVNDRPCTGKTVQWGLRKDKPAYLTSNCVSILAMEQNSTRDYSIFRVDPIPRASVKMRYDARPPVDTPLTIFSHPSSRPLEWSKTCVLKPGDTGHWGADMISHQCDTEPGSSGATVLDDNTLEIVAIHDGGIAPWNYATYLQATPLTELVGPSGNEWPTVSINGPSKSDIITGTVEVTARASDVDGSISRVSFQLPDGSVVDTTVAPYSVTWDSTQNGDGARTIKVTAFDNVGGKATAAQTVTVDNGLAPWSATSTNLSLPIADNGVTCTEVEVDTPGWAMDAKIDLEGNHAHRGGLRATLEHGKQKIIAADLRSLGSSFSAGNFTVSSRAIAGFTGKAAGTWKLCIEDTDTRVGTGALTKFNVHD
jgi:V8-like Glu-specific endopeptidase